MYRDANRYTQEIGARVANDPALADQLIEECRHEKGGIERLAGIDPLACMNGHIGVTEQMLDSVTAPAFELRRQLVDDDLRRLQCKNSDLCGHCQQLPYEMFK